MTCVATVLLVRHGRSSANSEGVLAGRSPGVSLDETGRRQAADVGARIAGLPIAVIMTSPLERCRQTARAIAAAHPALPGTKADARLNECAYGDWSGQELKRLAKQPLWKVVQQYPSGATFPGGESLREMQARGVAAVRDADAAVAAEHGDAALWVAVTHGDLIKSVLADALGMHLDNFQRIVVDPGSVSVISYTPLRPFVVRLNEHGDLSGLAPTRRKRRPRSSDAAVGGDTGS